MSVASFHRLTAAQTNLSHDPPSYQAHAFEDRRPAAAAETGHCLLEVIVRDICECARYGRRIDGKTADRPIQPNRAHDVIDLELARVGVAQNHVGGADRRETGQDPRPESPVRPCWDLMPT
jgi:hypothetical protein